MISVCLLIYVVPLILFLPRYEYLGLRQIPQLTGLRQKHFIGSLAQCIGRLPLKKNNCSSLPFIQNTLMVRTSNHIPRSCLCCYVLGLQLSSEFLFLLCDNVTVLIYGFHMSLISMKQWPLPNGYWCSQSISEISLHLL